jgi:hypothetical protein
MDTQIRETVCSDAESFFSLPESSEVIPFSDANKTGTLDRASHLVDCTTSAPF